MSLTRFAMAASVIAMTVALFGTSTAFADEGAPKPESAKSESGKTESTKTPKPKAEAPKPEAPKKQPEANAAEPAPKPEASNVEAPAPVAPAPEPAPLQARPTKALTLAPQSESTPWGYKLFAIVVIAGGIVFWVKKRKKIDASTKKPARLEIVARSSVGVRSELIVVEVDGTRLLVGMTPSAISTLAILDSGDPMMAPEERATEPAPEPLRGASGRPCIDEPAALVAESVKDRVTTLFGSTPSSRPSAEPPTQRMKRAPTTVRAARATRAPVAAQAKGLLLALEDDRTLDR